MRRGGCGHGSAAAEAPGDEERLDALLERLDLEALPAALCWCWPDRDPVPVGAVAPDWLRQYARDRAVCRLPTRRAA